jgi:transglutaminase-like putative cysteine protease
VRYRVRHRTVYRYGAPVSHCLNLAHLRPRASERQRCLEVRLEADPSPDLDREWTDFYGNWAWHFALQRPHQTLTVSAASLVEVEPSPEPDAIARLMPWEQVAAHLEASRLEGDREARQFMLPSPFVPLEGEVRAFAEPSFPSGRPLADAVADLTGRIHRELAYDPGFSTVATPLGEVLTARRGVCQDFAHLGIACLRSLGLPARYVSGYLETLPPPGKEKLQGSDASHAWFAAYLPGCGWVDFDPTNDMPAGERHITVAWGRDYGDVAPLRGIVTGGGAHTLEVAVDVEAAG